MPPWSDEELTADGARLYLELVRNWVDVGVFGAGRAPGGGALDPGTAFVAGAEHWTAQGGLVRRANAVFLWSGPGAPAGPVAKLHLVPTGETMMGFERYAPVRRAVEPGCLKTIPGSGWRAGGWKRLN